VMFYTTAVWNNQIYSGDNYSSFKKISVIAITSFDSLPEDEHYLRYYPIMSMPTSGAGESFIIGRMAYINLAKFNVPIDQLKTPLERWIFSLRHPSGKNEYDEGMVIGDYRIISHIYDQRDTFFLDSARKNQYRYEEWNTNNTEDCRITSVIRGIIGGEIGSAIKMIDVNEFSITKISELTDLQEKFIIELKEMRETKFHSKPLSNIIEYYSERDIEKMVKDPKSLINDAK
jgi:predicted transposase/invertase (TIGR01784 family)